jgi:hypothetical protein
VQARSQQLSGRIPEENRGEVVGWVRKRAETALRPAVPDRSNLDQGMYRRTALAMMRRIAPDKTIHAGSIANIDALSTGSEVTG